MGSQTDRVERGDYFKYFITNGGRVWKNIMLHYSGVEGDFENITLDYRGIEDSTHLKKIM